MRKLDFDGEHDELSVSQQRRRYRNAVGATTFKQVNDSLKIPSGGLVGSGITSGGTTTAPTGGVGTSTALNQPISSGIVSSGVTSGGTTSPTPVGGLGTATELNQPATGVVGSGVLVGGGIKTPYTSSGTLQSADTIVSSGKTPSLSSTDTTQSTPIKSPAPPQPSTPTFTEGILIGSGLLGTALQNATTPRFGGGGGGATPRTEEKGEVVFADGYPKKTASKGGLIKPLLIGSVVVGALYLIFKSK